MVDRAAPSRSRINGCLTAVLLAGCATAPPPPAEVGATAGAPGPSVEPVKTAAARPPERFRTPQPIPERWRSDVERAALLGRMIYLRARDIGTATAALAEQFKDRMND